MSRNESTLHTAAGLAFRVRFLSCAIALVWLLNWAAWFFPFDDWLDRSGTPLGGDCTMFYAAGRLILEGHPERLYDSTAQTDLLHRLFPTLAPNFHLPYRYPPVVAAVLAPLAALPYPAAFALFSLASIVAWFVALRLLIKDMPWLRGTHLRSLVCLALGWPVILETWTGGQASALAVLIAVASWSLLQRGRWHAAGCVLAMSAYKPNVLAFWVLGCLLRYPRALVSFCLTLAAGGMASCWLAGPEITWDYLALGTQLAIQPWDLETPLAKTHGLAVLLRLILPGGERRLLLALGVLLVVALVFWERRRVHGNGPFSPLLYPSLLLAINSLCNPYVPIYDLALLFPAGCYFASVVVDRLTQRGGERDSAESIPLWISLALALLFFGPHFSQTIAGATGLQLFSLGYLTLVVTSLWWVHHGPGAAGAGLPLAAPASMPACLELSR